MVIRFLQRLFRVRMLGAPSHAGNMRAVLVEATGGTFVTMCASGTKCGMLRHEQNARTRRFRCCPAAGRSAGDHRALQRDGDGDTLISLRKEDGEPWDIGLQPET
jgi:hypothetical protein